ncbi:MAG: choice-of-anchor Q domain-containing protein [Phycisphaerales bacterium JB040]
MMLAGTATAQSTLYVDDDAAPGGDGASWATAYAYLSDAIADATASGGVVTEIRIAGGTYVTDRSAANPGGSGLRTDSFIILGVGGGLTLSGGYAGVGAANPDDRDTGLFETVLSAEIGAPGLADNSYNVVQAISSGPVTLDGLTLTGGNANSFSSGNVRRGGGFYLFNGTGTVVDCDFTGNYGRDGGAIHANFGAIDVHDSTFVGNSSQNGGGIFATGADTLVTGSSFVGNTASSFGGAMRRAGGLTNSFDVFDCEFDSNSAITGGAIELFVTTAGPTFERCAFRNNQANSFGGAIANLAQGMTVASCLFEGNTAGSEAGAIGTSSNGTATPGPDIVNSTVVDNFAPIGGGVSSLSSVGLARVLNSIVWGNTDNGGAGFEAQVNQSRLTTPNTFTVEHSLVMGLVVAGPYDNGTNTSADPEFVDGSLGDYRLSAISPAIDLGDNAFVPGGVTALDLDGLARIVDGDFDGTPTVDAGAYEFVSSDSDGDGLDDVVENQIGTDPFNPDTDADGLLDGTEVDIAAGFGCPDPLSFDSDGDGLSDGDEVLFGTSPCLADTDGDGVSDLNDPTPTEPGVTEEFLVEAIRAAADQIDSIPLSSFTGPNANADRGRQNSLASRVRNAANKVGQGNGEPAVSLLMNVLERVDGDPQPKDWIEAGPDQVALKDELELLIALLLM